VGRPRPSLRHIVSRHIVLTLLPHYANTHTLRSHSGCTSTSLREESRLLVASSLGASYSPGGVPSRRSPDSVLFLGEGTTRAVQVLVDALGKGVERGGFEAGAYVLASKMEHHSNLLPWR